MSSAQCAGIRCKRCLKHSPPQCQVRPLQEWRQEGETWLRVLQPIGVGSKYSSDVLIKSGSWCDLSCAILLLSPLLLLFLSSATPPCPMCSAAHSQQSPAAAAGWTEARLRSAPRPQPECSCGFTQVWQMSAVVWLGYREGNCSLQKGGRVRLKGCTSAKRVWQAFAG